MLVGKHVHQNKTYPSQVSSSDRQEAGKECDFVRCLPREPVSILQTVLGHPSLAEVCLYSAFI